MTRFERKFFKFYLSILNICKQSSSHLVIVYICVVLVQVSIKCCLILLMNILLTNIYESHFTLFVKKKKKIKLKDSSFPYQTKISVLPLYLACNLSLIIVKILISSHIYNTIYAICIGLFESDWYLLKQRWWNSV